MSGKANRAASRLTLGSTTLDGYNGPVEVISRGRRRWWHRLLRRTPAPRIVRAHVDAHGSMARVWRRDG